MIKIPLVIIFTFKNILTHINYFDFYFGRKGTIKHSLSYIPKNEEIDLWRKVNFDEPLKENAPKHNNTLLIQKTPGKEFGMSFVVQEERKALSCLGSDGAGFRASYIIQILRFI
jgi:hypothetical protein